MILLGCIGSLLFANFVLYVLVLKDMKIVQRLHSSDESFDL